MDDTRKERIGNAGLGTLFLDLLREGAAEPGDCGQPSDQKPSWLDKEKLCRVRAIYEEHCPGILLGHFMGEAILSQVPSLAGVMLHTGNHSTLELATKRAVMTVGYVVGWYKGRVWDPDDPAHKSVQAVRALHKKAQINTSKGHPKSKEEGPWMSQYDMALTQFAFLGPLVLFGQRVGLYCDQEEMECLIHFWRYIAFLLGTKDEYNLGSLPYEELLIACQNIVKEISIPTFTNPVDEFTNIGRIGTEGYSYLNRLLDYDALHNFACELLGIEESRITLDWNGYFCSLFFWLQPKLFRFQYFRQLTAPVYRRTLEHKISSFLKNGKTLPYINQSEVSEDKLLLLQKCPIE